MYSAMYSDRCYGCWYSHTTHTNTHETHTKQIHPQYHPLFLSRKVDLRDIEAATILSMRYILDTTNLLQGPGARQALVDWLVLLHEAHPVKSCRKGAEKALKKVDKYWSTQRPGVAPSAKMFDMHICGKHAVVRVWGYPGVGCVGKAVVG